MYYYETAENLIFAIWAKKTFVSLHLINSAFIKPSTLQLPPIKPYIVRSYSSSSAGAICSLVHIRTRHSFVQTFWSTSTRIQCAVTRKPFTGLNIASSTCAGQRTSIQLYLASTLSAPRQPPTLEFKVPGNSFHLSSEPHQFITHLLVYRDVDSPLRRDRNDCRCAQRVWMSPE